MLEASVQKREVYPWCPRRRKRLRKNATSGHVQVPAWWWWGGGDALQLGVQLLISQVALPACPAARRCSCAAWLREKELSRRSAHLLHHRLHGSFGVVGAWKCQCEASAGTHPRSPLPCRLGRCAYAYARQHCEQKVHCSCVCGKCNWCTVPQAERWHSAALPAGRNHPAEPSSLAGLASHSACPLSRRLLVQTASNALWGGIAAWSPCVSAFWRLPGCQISATQPPQACGRLLPRPALFHICLTLPTLDQHPDRHEV